VERDDFLLWRDTENYSNIDSQEGTPLHSGKGKNGSKGKRLKAKKVTCWEVAVRISGRGKKLKIKLIFWGGGGEQH